MRFIYLVRLSVFIFTTTIALEAFSKLKVENAKKSLSNVNQNDYFKVFKFNEKYKFKVENQGIIGFGELRVEKRNEAPFFNFILPIRVFAAFAFSVVDKTQYENAFKLEMSKQSNGVMLPSLYKENIFKVTAKSISEIPELKSSIEKMFSETEKLYSTRNSQLTLKLIFEEDESKFYIKDGVYQNILSSTLKNKSMSDWNKIQRIESARMQTIRRHFENNNSPNGVFTTFMTSMNTIGFLYPTLLTFDTDKYSLAHEFGHLFNLSMHGYEGYLLKDYPATGIMNDSLTLNEALSFNLVPGLHMTELNSMLLHVAINNKSKINQSVAKDILKNNTSQFLDFIDWGGGRTYFEVPIDESKLIIEKKIKYWIEVGSRKFIN